MSWVRPAQLFWAGAVLLTACSLFVRFDPEGQPCQPDGGCLPTYQCISGVCTQGTGDCGGCEAGFRCQNGECVAATCAYKICPVGLSCSDDAGFPVCRFLEEPELGHPCDNDSDCSLHGLNRVCYFGAVQVPSGALRPGVCMERCSDAGTCLTSGTACTAFWFGRDAGGTSLCSQPNLVRGCATDDDCGGDAPLCTVFDHAATGPVGLCDKPLSSGAVAGDACAEVPANGPLCASGLCVPQGAVPGQTATCGRMCDATTCSPGSCQRVEYKITDYIRHIPMCVGGVTACSVCTGNANCGADAPRCTLLNAELRCLAACSPAAGAAACPAGFNCTLLGDQSRCVPLTGTCP